ncbi:MAG: hypothetical protein HY906_01735 [Deltaproteobacteria bacterium]|nr:hypothetical protein [Deltaproteobacteria bacterium]
MPVDLASARLPSSPISAAKAEANRRNAKLSTGPRTEAGKAKVALNHLIHGLAANRPVLPDENPEEYEALVERLRDELRPEGELEALLVERIAAQAWRLQRALRVEVGALELHRRDGDEDIGVARAILRDHHQGDIWGKVTRYERSTERSMIRLLHELERRQAARRGEHVPVPAVADLDVQVAVADPEASASR